MQKLFLILVAVGLPFAASGCKRTVQREVVVGTVTLDGKPLEQGSILFSPLASGPSAGGEIRQGRFELIQQHGPSADKYRVEINAWAGTGKSVYDPERKRHDEIVESIIPPRYNTQSKLEVKIEPGTRNKFDFQLSSS